MQDDPFGDRLKRLGERIEAARREPKAVPTRRRSHAEASGLGWRMVTELLAGMLIGLAIGYGLDSLFGTLPVFLVVFALLGFAAGVRTMMRSAEEVRRKQAAEAGAAPPAGKAGTQPAGKNGRDGPEGPSSIETGGPEGRREE